MLNENEKKQIQEVLDLINLQFDCFRHNWSEEQLNNLDASYKIIERELINKQ